MIPKRTRQKQQGRQNIYGSRSTLNPTNCIQKHTTMLHSTSFTLLPAQTWARTHTHTHNNNNNNNNNSNAHNRTHTHTGKVFRAQRRKDGVLRVDLMLLWKKTVGENRVDCFTAMVMRLHSCLSFQPACLTSNPLS